MEWIFDLITVIPKVYILLGIMFIKGLLQERLETIYSEDDDSEKSEGINVLLGGILGCLFYSVS